MKPIEKLPESKVKIRFPDCDPFNHLNNSRYIDYFLNAREDHLQTYYDFDLYRIAREKGISWVVAQNQVAYLAPAMLVETVVIQTRLLVYDEKSLVMEALMWSEDKTQLKALLWSKFVHVNLKTGKSEVHAPEFMALFTQLVHPLDEALGFDDRAKQLKLVKPAV